MTDLRIEVYPVINTNLPEATKLMNRKSDQFESRVVEIIVGDRESLVIVELKGSYPFITEQWEKVINATN
jgi:hypothetical protein